MTTTGAVTQGRQYDDDYTPGADKAREIVSWLSNEDRIRVYPMIRDALNDVTRPALAPPADVEAWKPGDPIDHNLFTASCAMADEAFKIAGILLTTKDRYRLAQVLVAALRAPPSGEREGIVRDLDARRTRTLARVIGLLSAMAGDGVEIEGFDTVELYDEAIMALGIEDAESPDIMASVIAEDPEGHGLFDRHQPAAERGTVEREDVEAVFAEDIVAQSARLGVNSTEFASPSQWKQHVRKAAILKLIGGGE